MTIVEVYVCDYCHGEETFRTDHDTVEDALLVWADYGSRDRIITHDCSSILNYPLPIAGMARRKAWKEVEDAPKGAKLRKIFESLQKMHGKAD